MKKIKAGVLFLLWAAVLLLSTSCKAQQQVPVDTLLALDSLGAGSRTITCRLTDAGLDSDAAQALDALVANYCPSMLHYAKLEENGDLRYQFRLEFSSYTDYTQQIAQLLGRKPVIIVSFPDTVFATGSRISEDFESGDLFSWLYAAISLEGLQGELSPRFYSGSTAVSLDGRTQTTGDRISLNRTQGHPLDAIFLDTVNNGDGTYDRTVTFRIPLATVHELGEDLKTYMNARTDAKAVSAQWTDFVSGTEYTVKFQGLTLSELSRCTNLLFNSRFSGTLDCGEHTDGSTPFIDGFHFTETLDLSSYTGAGGRDLPIRYRYASKSQRSVAKGETYLVGSWNTAGTVEDNVYCYEGQASMLDIRVLEQREHLSLETVITLSCLGDGQFQRDVDFLFDTQDNAGVQYAMDFLSARKSGATVEQRTSEQGLLCHVTAQGSAEEISQKMTALFGEQNVMSYASSGASVQVHHTTQLSDTIRMAHLYTGANQNAPITYQIKTNGKEQLNDLRYTSETHSSKVSLSQNADGAVSFSLYSGDTVIEYNGYTANHFGIFLVFLAIACVVAAVIALILHIRRRDGKAGGPPPPSGDLALYDPEESIEEILAEL